MKKSNGLTIILVIALSVAVHAQSMVLVKVYDTNMKTIDGLGLALDEGKFHKTGEDGTLYLEIEESLLPPKAIAIIDPALEAESWNYSKGILEVIVRKKTYKLTTIILKDAGGKNIPGLTLNLQTPDPVSRRSNESGILKMPVPLTMDILTTNLLDVPGFTISDRRVYLNQLTLKLEPVLAIQTPVRKAQQEQAPFNLAALDSIQSLTVFYGFIKNLDIQRLSGDLRSRIDAKFYQLLNSQNDSLGFQVLQNPIGKISDSSLVSEDINLLIEHARREELTLDRLNTVFDEKIALISSKLMGGGANLDAASREDLLNKIDQLDQILTGNSLYFSSTKSDYHDILLSLRNRLLNIKDLEDKLTDVQNQRVKDQQAFRDRLFKISLIILGLSIVSFVLLILLRKINRQKHEIDLAHRELNEVNSHLEELVMQRTKLLKQANEELDTFMYRSSHDLRRPITSILGLVQIATMTLKGEAMELFHRVASTAQSMDRMLQKLIMVSHINQPIETTRITFEGMREKYSKEFQGLITGHGIKVNWNLAQDLSFQTCPIMFDIIIKNLLENALQFSAGMDVTTDPSVSVDIFEEGDDLILKVGDNAGGIAPKVQSNIWNMFFVGHEKSGGNGLGLYITRRAVNKLGADIKFEVRDGGTLFTVRIPKSKSESIEVKEMVTA